jgi:hypothetical protein
VNLERFIVRLLPRDGLYLNLEEVPGLRSYDRKLCELAPGNTD